MKKIFTLLAFATSALAVSAADYTDRIMVNVDGNVMEQTATISLTQTKDDSYTFTLKNFALIAETDTMYIGTIELNGVEGKTTGKTTTLYTSQSTKIKEGDIKGVELWMGTILPEVPIVMTAKETGGKLYAAINIDMTNSIGQKIQVVFGDGGFQLPNAGFENYHTYSVAQVTGNINVDEPLSWHSFASASGSMAGTANKLSSNPHTFKSAETRPGTSGKYSVLVVSSSAAGIVANGTITTGRMNAGAMSASDPKNHAELDTTKKEKDGNGDPFYATLNGQPDSIAVWVKYKQKEKDEKHPYATISAAITNGTYYQDPGEKNKTYTNVLATAKNNTISSNGFEWQRVSVPFKYINDNVAGKTILVTISTNADPGKGTTADTIYVDDIELIYTAEVTSASVGGKTFTFKAPGDTVETEGITDVKAENIETVCKGKAATVETNLTTADNDIYANIKATSNDLRTVNFYTIKFKNANLTGIENAKSNANDKIKAVYDITGQKVNAMQHGQTYIILHESGKAEKVMH